MTRREFLLFVILGLFFAGVAVSYGMLISGVGKARIDDVPRTYDRVRVVLETLPTSFSPISGDAAVQHVLLNVYEGLVKIDGFFRVTPGLAYSWGNSDTEGLWWEFQLRPTVRFHSGEQMTIDHVRTSFTYYQQQTQQNEYVAQLLASIDRFEYEGQTVRIKTKYPDPLLLYRLNFLFILPEIDFADDTLPNGTGPYTLHSRTKESLYLTRFEDYWGKKPAVMEAELAVVEHALIRQQELLSGVTDILLAVPAEQQFLDRLEAEPLIRLFRMPSLEMIYLMFNQKEMIGRMQNPLAVAELREAVSVGIDRTALARIPLLTTLAKQYVASGVFGYDMNATPPVYDPERTKEILGERYLTLRMAVPQSFQILGEAIRNQLDPLHIRIELDVYEDARMDEFLQGVREQRFQIYLLGTKYDLADSIDFFRAVAHSQERGYGTLNGSGFVSMELDDQIKRAEQLLDQEERLLVLQDIQRTLMDARIGLPLFELDKVYAVHSRLDWQPRMDGYMVLSEIR